VENMLGGWRFRFVHIKDLALLGPNKGKNKGQNIDKSLKIFFS